MIDLHCHILPEIDDGASSEVESLNMLRMAVDEGITTIVATPHHRNRMYDTEPGVIFEKVAILNRLIQKHGLAIQVVPGQEVRLYGDLLEDYENQKLVSIDNALNYILIEFPSGHVPRYTEQLLFNMQLQGLMPIIAHPERNVEIIQNPDKLLELVGKGALTQLTAGSITGHFGRKIQKFSHQLIEANLAHVIASDAHNTTNRPFRMRDAMTEVENQHGINQVYYFQENAHLILEGKVVYPESPNKVRKKFLGII